MLNAITTYRSTLETGENGRMAREIGCVSCMMQSIVSDDFSSGNRRSGNRRISSVIGRVSGKVTQRASCKFQIAKQPPIK